MEEEPTFQTYGFDTFIGRVRFDNGFERITSLDLHSLGSLMGITLNDALRYLCMDIKSGKRILLYKSPGGTDLREVALPDIEGLVRRFEFSDEKTPIKYRWEVVQPMNFVVFNLEELNQLQEMYERRKDMKSFPNPFLYQPE